MTSRTSVLMVALTAEGWLSIVRSDFHHRILVVFSPTTQEGSQIPSNGDKEKGQFYMFKKSLLMAASFAIISFTGSDLLADGAFGLEFGQALPEKAEPIPDNQGGYVVEAPSAYPEFERYLVTYHETTGVCAIIGVGKTYEDDEWGIAVKSSYEKLISTLSKKYGSVQRQEFLRPGALWDESDEFSRSIDKNQRSHAAIWEIETEDPTSTSRIVLSVRANRSDTSLDIVYASLDFLKCQTAIEEEAEGSL